MGHAVEVVCFIFLFLMVLFLYVMWMIYCMDDMMAFTVVFNILKINKVQHKYLNHFSQREIGSSLISGFASCVGRVCQQC